MSELYPAKCNALRLFEPTDDSAIKRFEESMGECLPESYRDFLLHWNGVSFFGDELDKDACFIGYDPNIHPMTPAPVAEIDANYVWNTDVSIESVEILYGIHDSDNYRLGHADWHSVFYHWASTQFLPIGQDNIEGVLCISMRPSDKGAVFHWDKPEFLPEEKDQFDPMHFFSWVAPDFYVFWSLLYLLSEDEKEDLLS